MNEKELRTNAIDNNDDSPDIDPVSNDPEILLQHRYFRIAMSSGSASIDVSCPVDCIQDFNTFVSSAFYSLLVACDETIRDLEKEKFKKFLQQQIQELK